MSHFAFYSAREINSLLDDELSTLYKPWKGSIPFCVHVVGENTPICMSLFNQPLKKVNICDYLGGGMYPTRRLYFCRKKYPPPNQELICGGVFNECQGWLDLRRDLCTEAHCAGNPIISNGGNGNKNSPCRFFKCVGFRNKKSRAQEVNDQNTYRNTTLTNNDKANRRKGGKSGPRRINTKERSNECTHTFTLRLDDLGFYVYLEHRSGNSMHEHQPKLYHPDSVPIPLRLLTKQ